MGLFWWFGAIDFRTVFDIFLRTRTGVIPLEVFHFWIFAPQHPFGDLATFGQEDSSRGC